MKSLLIGIINIYQKTLSPDHGPFKDLHPNGFCKYYPSCSQYTKESIQKYGSFKGTLKGAYRVLRCNPCSQGGVDLP
jgi:putative membrane protein insertion efficiency factor